MKNAKNNHVKIPLKNALLMIAGYTRIRIMEQIRSVAFIIIYLIVFKTVILNVPFVNALTTSLGIGLVILGLTFFLEGLLLGLMPLGERVGLKLPAKSHLYVIICFGLLIGFGATVAEPAFAIIRTAGKNITAWETPLLFLLLECHSEILVISIGISVGIAVAIGMIRLYFGLSIKPFILVIIPFLLIISIAAYFDENLRTVIGLAWDSGAITTGPVTVPLILALGIGVSRSKGEKKGGGGFGLIMLASALPILGVLVCSLIINISAPYPVTEESFFDKKNREFALKIFQDETKLLNYAFIHGTEVGRIAFFQDNDLYVKTVLSMSKDPLIKQKLIGNMKLDDWINNRASEFESSLLHDLLNQIQHEDQVTDTVRVLAEESFISLQAIIPLSIFFLIVLLLFLRDKPRYIDQVVFGIFLAFVGMTFLTSGIRLGLAPLGDSIGSQLPRAFSDKEQNLGRITIENFDPSLVFKSISVDGTVRNYFYLYENNKVRAVEYFPGRFNPVTMRYEHVVSRPPLFKPELTVLGIALVLIFAFGMGYGSTLAEPALKALGKTVEGVTVGTVKQAGIVNAVSIGVGMGLVAGITRMLFDIPTLWILIPPYILLLLFTLFSSEEFTGVSWDSGGVTTGPVTVPLVLSMGLGIGGQLGISEGFGILALASVYPILSVMTYGFYVRIHQHRLMFNDNRENKDE